MCYICDTHIDDTIDEVCSTCNTVVEETLAEMEEDDS
jgi:ACT domain-containing protein